MWFHLRFAAIVSAAWLIVLLLRPGAASKELLQWLPGWVAIALVSFHAALAALYWWGSYDPPQRLVAVYTALVTFALRAAAGIYLVLYVLAGGAAMLWLAEMVLSIGFFSAFVNALPPTVQAARQK